MIISGFSGKGGSLSSRSSGIAYEEDRSGGFLNLVRSIAGDDLLFCFDPDTIGGVAVGGGVDEWNDTLGAYDTNFTTIGTTDPSLGLYNNKLVLNFDGTGNGLRTTAEDTQLLGKKELSLLIFTKTNAGSDFEAILEFSDLWYRHGAFTIGDNRASSDFAGYFAQANNISQINAGAPTAASVDVDLPLVRGIVFNRNGVGGGPNTTTKPYINGLPFSDDDIYQGDSTFNIDAPFAQINPPDPDEKMHFYLGQRGANLHYNGSIGIIVAITRVLTDAEMETLSRAILRKHNLGTTAPIVEASAGGGGSGVTYNIDEVAGQNITDAAGTLYDDGGPTGTYSQTDYTTYIAPGAGKKVVITIREFEMGSVGGGNFNEKLRFFNTTSGVLNFYGSMANGDANAPTQDQVITGIDEGVVTIIFDQSGYYGENGFFVQGDDGFKLTWEIVDV
tara:strand:+ start:2469 stop:3806 length:1338 start_codon:yes stop_codon:yes gene_type:complete